MRARRTLSAKSQVRRRCSKPSRLSFKNAAAPTHSFAAESIGRARSQHTHSPRALQTCCSSVTHLCKPAEIECLVRRLFAEPPLSTAGALRLNTIHGEPLSIGSRSLQHSVVLRAGVDAFEPAVIKLAPAAQVEDEYQNYMRYIYQQLPASRHSELQKYELIGFIGGIRYRFLGTSVVSLKTLADSFKDLDAEAINSCLTLFFGDTWLAKYKQAAWSATSRCSPPMPNAGVRSGLNGCRSSPLSAELLQFDIDGRRLRLPNPVPWLLTQVDVANGGQQDATGGYVHYCAVTHGDLHCGNLFIDKHREPWIIDYERTGEGPILRDFVELELDIILQGLSTTEAEPEIPPWTCTVCLWPCWRQMNSICRRPGNWATSGSTKYCILPAISGSWQARSPIQPKVLKCISTTGACCLI